MGSSVRFQIQELQRTRPPRPFQSNEEVLEAWEAWAASKLKDRTLTQYRQQIEMFTSAFGGILVTKVEEEDIQHYLDQYEARGCSHFQGAGLPNQSDRCREGHSLATCPVLAVDGICAYRKPREAGTTLHHLNALNHFFRFLRIRKHVPNNPIPEIRLGWQAENRHLTGRRIERIYTREEIALICRVKQPHIRFLFILLLKTGIRISEAMALTIDSAHFNVVEGWIKVPCIGEKRCGYRTPCDGKRNHYLIIDDELDLELRKYLRWRKTAMAHHADAERLIVGPYTPTPTYGTIYRYWAKPTLKRLGLYESDAGSRRLFHAARHTFTTAIRANGCDDGWTEVLRGCLPPGNLATYHHPSVADIGAVYQKYGPRF